MTLRDWLRARTPAPPPALRLRLESAIGAALDDDARTASDSTVAAAERLLVSVLAEPSAGRECALDLLTVDALVTYAFEAASTEPTLLVARAEGVMRRLAVVATAGAAAGPRC